MDRRAAWVLGILFGGLFLCLFAFLILFYAALKGGSEEGHEAGPRGRGKVGVVEISGPIGDVKRTLKELRTFERDDEIRALVVRVDSPGGEVGPSQELYSAIERIKKKKRVVVSMGSLAASGGFYLSCAADKVYADPGTLTGSIGVIMQTPNVQGLLRWAGVSMNTLTAGKMKDVGSPFREMSPDERKYLLDVLEDVHRQFIEAVARGRGLKVAEVEPIADGRIFTGRQAKELKLVDELGGFEDAVAAAGKLAGISGTPALEYPHHEKKLLRQLLGDEELDTLFEGAAARVGEALGLSTGLQYRLPTGIAP